MASLADIYAAAVAAGYPGDSQYEEPEAIVPFHEWKVVAEEAKSFAVEQVRTVWPEWRPRRDHAYWCVFADGSFVLHAYRVAKSRLQSDPSIGVRFNFAVVPCSQWRIVRTETVQ